jgi:hypothetical protein
MQLLLKDEQKHVFTRTFADSRAGAPPLPNGKAATGPGRKVLKQADICGRARADLNSKAAHRRGARVCNVAC